MNLQLIAWRYANNFLNFPTILDKYFFFIFSSIFVYLLSVEDNYFKLRLMNVYSEKEAHKIKSTGDALFNSFVLGKDGILVPATLVHICHGIRSSKRKTE